MKRLKKFLKYEHGLTLVELLAVIVILSIVGTFLLNIAVSSTKEGDLQSKESLQINDAAYVLKQITKDLRNTTEVKKSGNDYFFNRKNETGDILLFTYRYENNTLYRDGQIIANNIINFIIDNSNSSSVKISFTINGKESKTVLALRKGDF